MPKRVLVAEDEPNIATSLEFLLGRAGFDVLLESDGARTLDRVLEDAPDVLVLDVMLPGMDGYRILQGLRAAPQTAKLPVVMLTAKGQREDRETALEHGADLFITKPFSNADVIEAVKQLAGVSTG